jgi:hypothetical protein
MMVRFIAFALLVAIFIFCLNTSVDLLEKVIKSARRDFDFKFQPPSKIGTIRHWLFMNFTDGSGFRFLGISVMRVCLKFRYDPLEDVLTFEGRRYSGGYLRCIRDGLDGILFRVSNRDGCFHLERAVGNEFEACTSIAVGDKSVMIFRTRRPLPHAEVEMIKARAMQAIPTLADVLVITGFDDATFVSP